MSYVYHSSFLQNGKRFYFMLCSSVLNFLINELCSWANEFSGLYCCLFYTFENLQQWLAFWMIYLSCSSCCSFSVVKMKEHDKNFWSLYATALHYHCALILLFCLSRVPARVYGNEIHIGMLAHLHRGIALQGAFILFITIT